MALAGCGGDSGGEGGEEQEQEPLGEELAGSVAPLAQCRDWNRGTREEKLATIEDVRSQINLEDAPVEAPPLTDEQSLRLLDRACRPSYAAGFRLYKLYASAVAFAPLTADPESR